MSLSFRTATNIRMDVGTFKQDETVKRRRRSTCNSPLMMTASHPEFSQPRFHLNGDLSDGHRYLLTALSCLKGNYKGNTSGSHIKEL